MTNEQEGERAWAFHKAIENNELERRNLLYSNMKLIHEMHAQKYYKTILGDEEAPWSAYLTQFETFYSASKIYTLDKIYLKFIKELQCVPESISSIPYSKLTNLIPVVTKENVKEWLTKAETLTSQDFNDEVRVAMGRESYLDCKHANTKNYEICQSCGFRHAN